MNFIISIGGTGARIVESFVYLAATGVVDSTDEYKIFIVDKDKDCGNTGRLRTTVAQYQTMKSASGLTSCMKPSFEVEEWNLELFMEQLCKETTPNRAYNADTAVYQHIAKPRTEDQSILDIFHKKSDQTQQLKNGFYGCANLGSAILDEIFSTETFGSKNDNKLFFRIQQALNESTTNSVNIVLAASIFGGTGASIFPNMAKKLREMFPEVNIYGILMLPYFSYSDTKQNAAHDAIRWDVFRKKTAVALNSYSKIKNLVQVGNSEYNPVTNDFIFNSLKLIGSETLRKSCAKDSEGGTDQKHNFLITDLFAAMAIRKAFIRKVDDSAQNANIFTDYVQDSFNPSSIGTENARELQKFTEFAFAVRSYMYPLIHCKNFEGDDLLKKPFGIGFMHRNESLKMEDLKRLASITYPFCDAFIKFMLNIHSDLDHEDTGLSDVSIIDYIGLNQEYKFVVDKTKNLAGEDVKNYFRTVINRIDSDGKCILPGNKQRIAPQEYLRAWRDIKPDTARPNTEDGYKSILRALYQCADSIVEHA